MRGAVTACMHGLPLRPAWLSNMQPSDLFHPVRLTVFGWTLTAIWRNFLFSRVSRPPNCFNALTGLLLHRNAGLPFGCS